MLFITQHRRVLLTGRQAQLFPPLHLPPSCLVLCQLSLQVGLGIRVDVEVGGGTGYDSGTNGSQDLHRKTQGGKCKKCLLLYVHVWTMDLWIQYLTCSSTGVSIIVTLVSCSAGVRPASSLQGVRGQSG